MAELDRFERAFTAGWRKAYRRARLEGASLEEVADILTGTLAKDLRDCNGVPGFREMERIVRESAISFDSVGREAAALIAAFNALGNILRNCGDDRHTKIALEVANSLIVQPCEGDIALHLAKGFCDKLLEHRFFANARQNLVVQGKLENYEAAQQWQSRLEQILRPAITGIAEQIARNPDAEGLRAPNSIVKPESTSDLLNEDLTSIQTLDSASVG